MSGGRPLDNDMEICGIRLGLLACNPMPQELAAVVARWDSGKQASFFCFLMDHIKRICPVNRDIVQLQFIADELKGDSCEFGRDFICDVADMIRFDPEAK